MQQAQQVDALEVKRMLPHHVVGADWAGMAHDVRVLVAMHCIATAAPNLTLAKYTLVQQEACAVS